MSDDKEREDNGQFPANTSGNKLGRPKGSRNKITLVKLMAEQAVREDNHEDMLEVCKLVIEDALEGDRHMRKLVWESIVTKAPSESSSSGKEKVEIIINSSAPPEIKSTEPVEVTDYQEVV